MLKFPKLLRGVPLAIIVAAVLALVACGDDDGEVSSRGKAGTLAAVAPAATIPSLDATPSPGTEVVPNGDEWVTGPTAVVVLGGGSPQGIAARAQEDSGLDVTALWYLSGGRWQFAVPSLPEIDGGIPAEIEQETLSAIVVLR